jgi:hypothetical protein
VIQVTLPWGEERKKMVYVAPLISFVGLMIFAFAPNPTLRRVGEIAFFCGLLASLLMFPFSLHLYHWHIGRFDIPVIAQQGHRHFDSSLGAAYRPY